MSVSIPQKLRFSKDLDLFLKHVEPQSQIIEFEPGRGGYSQKFHEAGLKILSIEEGLESHIYPENPVVAQSFRKPFDEIVIPYRSLGGIWAHNVLSSLERSEMIRRFKIFYDWLAKSGSFSFSVLEGEGDRFITEQTPKGAQKRKESFYQASEIQSILDDIGFVVVDAWRERKLDRSILHIFAKRDNSS